MLEIHRVFLRFTDGNTVDFLLSPSEIEFAGPIVSGNLYRVERNITKDIGNDPDMLKAFT